MSDRRGIVLQHKDRTGGVMQPDGSQSLQLGPWSAQDVSPDRLWAAGDSSSGEGYEVRRIADGEVVWRISIKPWVRLAFSPDSRHLVTAGSTEVVVHECGTWREVARWPVNLGFQGMGWAEFSPDSRHLATLHTEGTVALHDTAGWKPVVHLRPPGPIFQHSGTARFQWTADSRRLLVLTQGHRISEWDITALREELGKLGLDW